MFQSQKSPQLEACLQYDYKATVSFKLYVSFTKKKKEVIHLEIRLNCSRSVFDYLKELTYKTGSGIKLGIKFFN